MEGTYDLRREDRPPPLPEGAVLYVVLDAADPLAPPARHALTGLDEVVIGRAATRGVQRQHPRRLRLELTDPYLSGAHLRLRRVGGGRWLLEDTDSHNGTHLDGRELATASERLEDGDVFQAGRTFFLFREGGTNEPVDLLADATTLTLVPSVERALRRLTRRGAIPERLLLLQAPPGTSPLALAEAVHRRCRPEGPFVAVDCAGLPPELAASILFGLHASHAPERTGAAVRADGGTLVLDHVEALPAHLAPALLRLADEGTVTPIGGLPTRADVLLVAATTWAPAALATLGAALLGRLQDRCLTVAPLRERLEDLGLLMGGFLRPVGSPALPFLPAAVWCLLRYPWPDDETELRQVVTRLAALELGRPVAPEDLPDPLRPADPSGSPSGSELAAREEVRALLEQHRGDLAEVARELHRRRGRRT